jgi:pimeloyl-ACP methyl ester carboxylesterase
VEIVRERTVAARDGTRLFFTERGEGEAIVLLDGLVCDGYIWRYLEPYFADTHRVVHPHHRGHGRSATPVDVNVRIEHLVDDLETVRREAGLHSMVLAGHSMGVQVALEYTRRRPSRVAGLALICGSHGRVLSTFQNTDRIALLLPIMRRAYERNPDRLRWLWENFPVRVGYQMALASRMVNPVLVRRPDLYVYLRHLRRVDIGLFLSLVKSLHRHDAAPYLSTLDVPALVVAGEHDTFTPPEVAERTVSELPRAQYLLVPGGSHSALIEMPELINLAVERFLVGLRWHGPEATPGS